MRINTMKSILITAVYGAMVLLLGVEAASAQQQINLTAAPTSKILPDGTSVPMWGYFCGAPVSGSTATCAAANPSASGWSPVTITVPTGQGLQINLTNNLAFPVGSPTPTAKIPTSIVIVGQLGGGLGDVTQRTTTPSPNHDNQGATWPIANGAVFTPPAQGPRVQSFSTEALVGTPATLKWVAPRAGTYLLESGTHPSIQATMGLIGTVVVTSAPASAGATGTAYTGVSYNAEVPLIFSEIDPNQNKAVDAAVNTAGFNESATLGTYLGGPVTSIAVTNGGSGYTTTPSVSFTSGSPTASATAVVDTDHTSPTFGQVTEIDIVNPGNYAVAPKITLIGGGCSTNCATAVAALQLQPNGIAHCQYGSGQTAAACYPPVVNYSPLYYLINGVAFDKTSGAANSLFPALPSSSASHVTGNVLVRLVNAGVHMHVPSIVGSTTASPAVGGFSLIAEDGNKLPGIPHVQSEVFMAAGKTYDVMINVPATVGSALPVYDRELSLSGNATARDAGMLAYISVNGAGMPTSPALGNATANADTYNALIASKPLSITDPAKGVIANDVNVYGVSLLTQAAHGTVTLNANGTFTYAPSGSATSDTFTYEANGNPAIHATVTLGPETLESAGGITCPNSNFTSSMGHSLKIKAPGILAGCVDAQGYPLTVNAGSITPVGGLHLAVDPSGGFTATVGSPNSTYTFTFKAQNAQGVVESSSALVTLKFPQPSGLNVTVLDGADHQTTISDYRWVIEEDRTFFVDPNCTKNPPPSGCPGNGSGVQPNFGTNFHTSFMPVIATGCTGDVSCAANQTVQGAAVPTPISALPGDVGLCPTVQTNPATTNCLDPKKRYYISVLPGDGAQPFIAGYAGAPDCSTAGVAAGSCGHGMGGAPIAKGPHDSSQSVTVLTVPSPYPPATLSVFVFEDDYPLNGEHDAGGGIDVLSPDEPGLGGFQITLADDAGGTGDATGTPTYDMFNMPLSNSLAGTIDPVSHLDACPISTQDTKNAETGDGSQQGIVGMIVTCPTYESDGSTLSPLAGQAIVKNLYQGRYGVIANPAADRIARGEEWLQTNTLDGQKAHDSFMRIGEPGYFQEFGPAGYHVTIGFANPKIINSRLTNSSHTGICDAGGTDCTHEVKGHVTTARMSRTPDERLYGSGTHDSYSFTQCYVSIGDPDGADFGFTKCDDGGNFDFTNIPAGNWKVTTFDQWNDQVVDGITTAVGMCNPGTTSNCKPVVDLGEVAVHQWQANIYTRTFFDTDYSGVSTDQKPGLPFASTNIRFRDGSFSNFNNTDLDGYAGFNEVFPLFNWYVIETDSTRYKNTGTHVVYDSGGPVDGSSPTNNVPCSDSSTTTKPCGSSSIAANYANTYEPNSLPPDLSIPGAVYCTNADCTGFSIANAVTGNTLNFPSSTDNHSTGRIDPAWVNSYGWQGFSGQNSFLEFGKKPYADGENGGIHGDVVYASTRPFDDPQLLLQLSWEPQVPHVKVNLYKEDVAADGLTKTLKLVDQTETSSFDDWAQGFRTVNKGIGSISVTNGGTGFTSAPAVSISGGGGTGAAATAVVSNGKVTAINLSSEGTGFATSPTITISGGGGSGATAVASVPTGGIGIPNMNCPGQGTDTSLLPDPYFWSALKDQPQWLDAYNNGSPTHALPYESEFKCYDGMHNWNQLQPAPYDGMYSFPSVTGIDPVTGKPTGTNCIICIANPTVSTGDHTDPMYDPYRAGTPMLPAGKYVVEVVVPEGYELVKEEDKNILIGDNYIAPVTQQFGGLGSVFILPDQASLIAGYNPNNPQNPTNSLGRISNLPSHEGDTGSVESYWPCVGEAHIVPDYISLFPGSAEVAPFAGATRPLCDRKEITLNEQSAALTKFYVYTQTHTAAHFTGIITDDFTAEFDPFSPQFGEKFAPAYLPVSFKDWSGNEISRVYSDAWGEYDGLNYSTWEVNPPNPTGYGPTMMVGCMNDAGPVKDPITGKMVPDPLFQSGYSQFCYELPFMPGQTGYFDTPVVPTSAFAGGYNTADCAYPDATPAVSEVDGDGVGPWAGGSFGSGALAGIKLTNGGSNYTSPPTVTISGNAKATATISGSVISVSLSNFGTGYTSVPAVNLIGGGGSGATATASITGKVASATVSAGGSHYTSAPSVTFNNTGTGGSGAAGTATISGSVVSVTITNGGSGYTGTASVTFNNPGSGGVRATGTPVVSGGHITGVNITNAGSGYTSTPTITFGPNHSSSTRAAGTVVWSAFVKSVNITNSGSGYNTPPTIGFTGGGGGSGAAASATLTSSIASVTLTAGGSGYSTPPLVQFVTSDGNGSGAVATASIRGPVVSLALTNPGSGYSTAPTPSFSGGGGSGAAATTSLSAGKLTINALGDQLEDNYQYSGPQATAAPFNQEKTNRHYGFGTQCTSPTSSSTTCNTLSSVTIGGVNAPITAWSDTQIKVNVPSGVANCATQQQPVYGGSTAHCGQLVITSGNGKQSVDTVTITIGGSAPKYVAGNDPLTANGFGSIQKAIDAANPGDLIMVPPGTYSEMLLMWKPVRLQGVGAASSVIDANPHPAGKLDPWRQRVVCLFGLALNGTPITGANQYDPSNSVGCDPNMQFSVDRLPLEATVGWDATLNGNLAEQLAEPTLMGSYEGAGITVLSKGVKFPAGSDPFASDVFPDGTTLLTTGDCGNGNSANPYPSNFLCNPSSIDGLTVENSSQGGGGILVHAWGHELQIANNRVVNNQGTLSGGITVGQGEHPDAYLAGGIANILLGTAATNTVPGSCVTPGLLTPANMALPYCFNMDVNVHNNAVTQNSSLGDELFSSTPAGAGGVTFCNGSDYYKFQYNWVCGNMSTGDGAGVAHIGLTYDGDIEHNSIMFNESTNPTIVTNGGGLLVMGAPDQDPPCATLTDKDCLSPPGTITPSDGTGPGLVINANLLLGNSADSGSGGGMRLQHINGNEVLNFPNGNNAVQGLLWPSIPGHPGQPAFQSLTPWNAVNVTNNIIANNVAGWDGGGVSLQDALATNLINNTIVSNNSTASSGVLFQTLFAPLASTPGVNCTTNNGARSCPQPAGLVSVTNSAVLTANISQLQGGNNAVTCPAGHGTNSSNSTSNCIKLSVPVLYNDLFWQNRSLMIGVGGQAGGLTNQQNTVTVYNPVFGGTAAATIGQTSTGSCNDPNASYWDLGVRGDAAPGNHAAGVLSPIYSALTNSGPLSEIGGGSNDLLAPISTVVSKYCNGSRVPVEAASALEFPGWQAPPGTNESNALPAPPFTLAAAATVDEGNNWINLRWGPLSLNVPTVTFNPSLAGGSPAINHIPLLSVQGIAAPATDFFNNQRKQSGDPVDVGAIEYVLPPNTPLASVTGGPLAFGSVGTGSTSPVQTLTVSNTGNANVTGITVVVTAPFSRSGGSCAAATPVTPGSSCTIGVVFSPTTTGAASGSVTITSNVSVTGSPVSLSGTGIASVVAATLTPTSYTFPTTTRGARSGLLSPCVGLGTIGPCETFTLTNTGNVTLTGIGTPTISSNSANYKVVDGTCGTSLAAQATCSIVVQFLPPTSDGRNSTQNGAVRVTDAAGTQTSTLSGVAR